MTYLTLPELVHIAERILTLSNDQAYDLVTAVAIGELDEIPAIADLLRQVTEAR